MTNETIVDEIYRYIVAYKQAHDGNSPTIRQIQERCDVSSTSMVNHYLERLQQAGRVQIVDKPDGSKGRHIAVVGGRWEMAA